MGRASPQGKHAAKGSPGSHGNRGILLPFCRNNMAECGNENTEFVLGPMRMYDIYKKRP